MTNQERIKQMVAFRKKRDLSQANLADLIGAGHPRTVRRWENDETPVPAWVPKMIHAISALEAATKVAEAALTTE